MESKADGSVPELSIQDKIREKTYFNAVYTDSPVAVCLTDLSGKFLDVNEACARIWGYSRSELVGMTFQQITHPDDVLGDMRMMNRMISGEAESYEMTKRYMCKGGAIVWARLKVRAVKGWDGRLAHYIAHVTPLETAMADGFHPNCPLRSFWFMPVVFTSVVFSALSSLCVILHILIGKH